MFKLFQLGLILTTLTLGAVFAITFLSVETIEDKAKGFIVNQIKNEIMENKVFGVSLNAFNANLSKLKLPPNSILGKINPKDLGMKNFNLQINKYIEKTVNDICKSNCLKEKGFKLNEVSERNTIEKLEGISNIIKKLTATIRAKYYRILEDILFFIRILSGVGLIFFGTITLILFKVGNLFTKIILPILFVLLLYAFLFGAYFAGKKWVALVAINSVVLVFGSCYILVLAFFIYDVLFNSSKTSKAIVNKILPKNIEEE